MRSHENKLYILNNKHYWHKCIIRTTSNEIYDFFTNRYIKDDKDYFKCFYKECNFSFPSIIGPATYTRKICDRINETVYEMGPELTVQWSHIEQHKLSYIELDVSSFISQS